MALVNFEYNVAKDKKDAYIFLGALIFAGHMDLIEQEKK